MKLTKSQIEKRTRIFLDRNIYGCAENGIMRFGSLNDYPQIMERLVNGSKTAKASSKIYSRFLSGQGFENEIINNEIVGIDQRGKKITIRELLKQVCKSQSIFNGAYIHLNLNLDRKVVNASLIPFKFCRFTKFDDSGYTAKIAVYENWDADPDFKHADNKSFDKNKVRTYNVFNLDPIAFAAQIKETEIQNFKGQIYFSFLDNEFIYPLSVFDSVYLDCDTENQISLFKNRTIRDGFMPKTIIRFPLQSNENDKNELEKSIINLMGADGDQVLALEVDIDPVTSLIQRDKDFIIDSFPTTIQPDLFSNWEKELSNNIRKVVEALPAILIDYEEGKLSTTSGESIIQATNYYNSMTNDNRNSISQMFAEIFKNSINPILANNENWKIKELSIYPENIQSNGITT